jgi:hypothetical protein
MKYIFWVFIGRCEKFYYPQNNSNRWKIFRLLPIYCGLFFVYACTQGEKWEISFRVEFCILLWLTNNTMENQRKFRPNNDLEDAWRH